MVVVVGKCGGISEGTDSGRCCCAGGGDGVSKELTLKSEDVCRVEDVMLDAGSVTDGALGTKTSAGSKRIFVGNNFFSSQKFMKFFVIVVDDVSSLVFILSLIRISFDCDRDELQR